MVTFKGRKDGITVVLDGSAEFSQVEAVLRDKIVAAESFFGTSQAVIRFSGRELSDDETQVLADIIRSGSRLEVLDVITGDDVNADDEPPQEVSVAASETDGGQITYFKRGSLRSGQSVRYAGSVVLMGDVNAGAEIVAEGNVIVMGTIKGMVHAGCAGDTACHVAALSMQPTQLRIADVIIYIPADVVKKNKKRLDPVCAHIQDGEICISAFGNFSG